MGATLGVRDNRRSYRRAGASILVLCGSLLALPAAAQSSVPAPDEAQATADSGVSEIVVYGRGEAKIGVAHAASEGAIAGSDLLVRPLLRTAELLEAVPGMIAAQHSGSGKANQYFLRGFNLDHGSDFTTYIDDVPMSLRTHGHGQGYLDLNGLIPEVVEREDYRKGPYRADGGDFALAGAAYMSTLGSVERPWVAGEAGSFGWRRGAAAGSLEVGGGSLTGVAQVKVYDGPWAEPEKLRHYAGFLKYERPTSLGVLELTGHAYHATWNPTEQIPERIIGTAGCPDEFCAPDPTATGETNRFVANAKLSGDGWRGNVYAQFYDWDMFSNPTYFDAQGVSAQIHQMDRRWILGGKAEKTWTVSDALSLTLGLETRYDDIDRVGVTHTDARVLLESLGLYKVKETSGALYGEFTWRPVERLRVIGGIRGDAYRYNVRALDAPAAALGEGSGGDQILSPKINLAYEVSDNIELYADWGRGFHSNDVRGAVTTTPVPVLVSGEGKEVGARFQSGPFTLTATYWWLNVGSELKFVGDSNAVEPTGASNRHGYELVAFWRPLAWLAIDAHYTASHARYDNGDHIPNAFENAAALGVSAVSERWEGSIRLRHLGPYPLLEDNSVRDKGSNVVNARGAWKADRFEVYAEVLNILDSHDKDMAYWYEAYIPTFDAAPVEGRLSRVVEPRTLRVGLKAYF